MAELDALFRQAVENNASDIHLSPGEPYIIRKFGSLQKLQDDILTADRCRHLVNELLDQDQQTKLLHDLQLDFAYEIEGLGRFRGSAMMHRNGLSAVFRVIPPGIPTFETLGLPNLITKILDNHMGLVLVTGATGHGKSTTLATMVDYINTNRAHHILTIEDPIEFIHPLKRGVVNQRQLETDTLSYANALRAALREDPDVIMIGELRDLETISLAITAAETGHLVLGTLSTSNAPKTIDRIVDSFPPGEQNQIRAMLSESLRAVITQRLIPRADKSSMVLALEILIGILPMSNLIREGKVFQIASMMQTKKNVGMQIMDDSIFALHQEGKINAEEAYSNASNKERFKPLLAREKQSQANSASAII
jgi:twitching motility protein PilT